MASPTPSTITKSWWEEKHGHKVGVPYDPATAEERWGDDHDPNDWQERMVDLHSLPFGPVYTRKTLREALHLLEEARKNQKDFLRHTDNHGRSTVIWKNLSHEDKIEISGERWPNELRYITYQEMVCPDLALDPEKRTPSTKLLHHYNNDRHEHFPVPFVLKNTGQPLPQYLDSPEEYARLARNMQLIVDDYRQEDSLKSLTEQILQLAKEGHKISQCIGIGLGSIAAAQENAELKKRWQDDGAALQYTTVFHLAWTLTKYYKETSGDSQYPPVETIFQDPCLTDWDHKLLKAKSPCPVRFVRDPEAFLALNSETIFIAPFLPKNVPFLPIIADMFHGEDGPVAIICDKTNLDPNKREHCVHDRVTPRVVEFLTGYKHQNFDDHYLDSGFMKNVYSKTVPYWLWSMDLFTRRHKDDSEREADLLKKLENVKM